MLKEIPTIEEIYAREALYEKASSVEYDLIWKEALEQDLMEAIGTAGYSAVVEILKRYNVINL